MLIPIISPAAPGFSYSYEGSDVLIATGTTYTFSSKSLGDFATNKCFAIALVASVDTAGRTVSGVTIGGIAATKVAGGTNTTGGSHHAEIWIATVPADTGDVVVTTSANFTRVHISVYSLYDLTSNTPNDTATSTANPSSLNCDVINKSISIGVRGDAKDAGVFTWTGLTEDYDYGTGTYSFTTASEFLTSAETPRTQSVTIGSGALAPVAAAAVWNKA